MINVMKIWVINLAYKSHFKDNFANGLVTIVLKSILRNYQKKFQLISLVK